MPRWTDNPGEPKQIKRKVKKSTFAPCSYCGKVLKYASQNMVGFNIFPMILFH